MPRRVNIVRLAGGRDTMASMATGTDDAVPEESEPIHLPGHALD
jgi:hypothetical protein